MCLNADSHSGDFSITYVFTRLTAYVFIDSISAVTTKDLIEPSVGIIGAGVD